MYLSLGNPAGTVPENRGAMLVLVNLVGELDTTVTVTVKTEPGTGENAHVYLNHQIHYNCLFSALAGSDYITVSHDIIFDYDTYTTQRLYIPVVNDDDCVEEDETFYVNLYTSMDCVHVRNDSLPITIVDDDSECHIESVQVYRWRLSYGSLSTISMLFIYTTGF